MKVKKNSLISFVLLFLVSFTISCSKDDERIYNANEDLYIDSRVKITSLEDGAVIPANYLYPLIEFDGVDKAAKNISLKIESKNKKITIPLKTNKWRPVDEMFRQFLSSKKIYFSIIYNKDKKKYRSKKIMLNVSQQTLNDSIIYRLVEPLFNAAQTSIIKVYSITKPQIKELIKIDKTCIGCHGYSPAMDILNVKKNKDRRLIIKLNNQEQNISQKVIGQFSFFSTTYNGEFAAIVANTAGKISIKKQKIEPFNLTYLSGDIFVYHVKENTLTALNGASELDFVEDMPCFDSKNEKLVFSRYQLKDQEIESMDLYTVSFNNGKGGKAVPVKNASHNGKYHYFARFSPDGKWLSFCRGDGRNGIFAKSSSDIYLLNLKNNQVRKMSFNQKDIMDSWHYWSSDSRWMIFSSNRDKNKMTSMYMVYINEKGEDHPPVKLIGYEDYKINIPQFINNRHSFKYRKKLKSFLENIYKK